MARRLAVVAYGLYGARDYLARCGEDDREYLGYDDSLDHLPQQRWLKELAGDRVLAFRANDIGTQLAAVRAGLGLEVLPCVMAHKEPELVRVPTLLPPLTRELWLLFHRDIGRVPAVRAVIDRITAITTEARAAFLGSSARQVASRNPAGPHADRHLRQHVDYETTDWTNGHSQRQLFGIRIGQSFQGQLGVEAKLPRHVVPSSSNTSDTVIGPLPAVRIVR